MSYEFIRTWRESRVAIAQLDRPKVYNALSPELMQELMDALETFDSDDEIGCLVISGSEKVFSAGADIKYMSGATAPADMLNSPLIRQWDRLSRISKPVIAAVSGFALGGGCELAMACDMLVASESASFGQPEINIGVIPGAGGTQRLTRAVGKAVAMEMILNDRRLNAQEALALGLVNRVVPVADYLEAAIALGREIAARAPVAVRLAKVAINAVYEMPLRAGLEHESGLFYLLFGTEDQKEGMDAFVNKRPPTWQGK